MEKIALTQNEKKTINIERKMDYLMAQNRNILEKVKKIFNIWDGAFKFIGSIISVIISVAITLTTKGLYDVDGKWSFWTVFTGGIIFLVVLAILLWLTWALINSALTSKINVILLENNEE